MKNIFDAQSFMYRRPIKGISGLKNKNNWEILSHYIKQDNVFLEQLLVANEQVFNISDKLNLSNTGIANKKERDIKETMFNYLNRSYTRATPFGLFSAVGLGNFEKIYTKNDVDNNLEQIQKSVSVDFNWLEKYILFLEKKYYNQLRFSLNNSSYKNGDKICLLYCIDEDNNDEINISYTKLFDIIKNLCQGRYVLYNDILNVIIKEYGENYIEPAEIYMKTMIENRFLISEIMISPLNKEPLKVLVDKLKNSSIREEVIFVENLMKSIERYKQARIGHGISSYKDVETIMSKKINSDKYIQVDIFNEQVITLPEETKKEIEEFASFLNYISNKKRVNSLDKYKERFIEKYGIEQIVSLTELFDGCVGLGAPENYDKPLNEYFEYMGDNQHITTGEKTIFNQLYENALKSNSSIYLDECKNLFSDDINLDKVTPSMELYFKLYRKTGCLKPQLCLNNIIGCNNIGSSFGRFANRFKKIDKLYKELVEKDNRQYEEDFNIVEISLIPENKSEANVMRTINYREYELSLYCTKTDDDKKSVELENIYIGVENNNFFAVDVNTGKKLIFKKTNMYNNDLVCNEIKFLLEISNNYIEWYSFPWLKAYENMNYIPKIKYKDIILSNKQWNLNINDIVGIDSDDYEIIQKSIIDYFEKMNMSSLFLLSMADNEILFDLSKKTDLEVLSISFKKYHRKYGERAIVKIFDYIEAQFFKDSRNDYFSGEIVVPLLKKQIGNNKNSLHFKNTFHKRISTKERQIQPFDGWLYFKIYMKSCREDEFIVNELSNLIKKENQENSIDYFFVRYEDPKPHLRIRLKGDRDELLKHYCTILPFLEELIDRCFISEFIICSYDQEIERYGGNDLFNMVQSLFINDARLVESLLKRVYDLELDGEKEIISCVLNCSYLMEFYNDFSSLKTFFDIIGINGVSKDSSIKSQKNNFIEQIFSNKRGITGLVIEKFEILKEDIRKINEYMGQINISELKKAKIVDSIIHMNNNRFYGIDRKKESEIMEIARAILFKKHYGSGGKNGTNK